MHHHAVINRMGFIAPFDSAFVVVAVVNVATTEQQQQQHSTQN